MAIANISSSAGISFMGMEESTFFRMFSSAHQHGQLTRTETSFSDLLVAVHTSNKMNSVLNASGYDPESDRLQRMDCREISKVQQRKQALIRTMCKQGSVKDALSLLVHNDQGGFPADFHTFVYLLQGCSLEKSLAIGKKVHTHFICKRLPSNLFIDNALINMYGKCGSIRDAHYTFDRAHKQNVFLWTTLITGYAKHGDGWGAINLFKQMLVIGIKPDKFTFVSLLSACVGISAWEWGKLTHAAVLKAGCGTDAVVGGALLDMYIRCGMVDDALWAFDRMLTRNVFTWTTIIAFYAQNGNSNEGLNLFVQMQMEDIKPDKVMFLTVLTSCTDSSALELGKQLHCKVLDLKLMLDAIMCSAFIGMYARCGSITDARLIFDRMCAQDSVMWSAMITGYVQHGDSYEALKLFWQMQEENVNPDKVIFACVLTACSAIPSWAVGKFIHAMIAQAGIEYDNFAGNCLVDMYLKCEDMIEATQVFDRMPIRDVVSWNVIISGSVEHGLGSQALRIFREMQQEGKKPNKITFTSAVNACGSILALDEGKQLHQDIIDHGYESDTIIGSCLVNMYAKCRSIENARLVFDNMSSKDIISWNIIIAAYLEHGDCKEALIMFWGMLQKGLHPNERMFLTVLAACIAGASLQQVKQVHSHALKSRVIYDVFVGSSLVDIYSKRGLIEDAEKIFDRMTTRDVVAWNTIITGYARHKSCKDALMLIKQMEYENFKPDDVTFISFLHARTVLDEGIDYFAHIITPSIPHFSCMVDALGHAGQLDEAEELITGMPIQPNAIVWRSFLGSCRIHGDIARAENSIRHLLELECASA